MNAFQTVPLCYCGTMVDGYQHNSEICSMSLKCWYPSMKLDSIITKTPTVCTSSIIHNTDNASQM